MNECACVGLLVAGTISAADVEAIVEKCLNQREYSAAQDILRYWHLGTTLPFHTMPDTLGRHDPVVQQLWLTAEEECVGQVMQATRGGQGDTPRVSTPSGLLWQYLIERWGLEEAAVNTMLESFSDIASSSVDSEAGYLDTSIPLPPWPAVPPRLVQRVMQAGSRQTPPKAGAEDGVRETGWSDVMGLVEDMVWHEHVAARLKRAARTVRMSPSALDQGSAPAPAPAQTPVYDGSVWPTLDETLVSDHATHTVVNWDDVYDALSAVATNKGSAIITSTRLATVRQNTGAGATTPTEEGDYRLFNSLFVGFASSGSTRGARAGRHRMAQFPPAVELGTESIGTSVTWDTILPLIQVRYTHRHEMSI